MAVSRIAARREISLEDCMKQRQQRVNKTSICEYLINVRVCKWRGHGDWWATVRTKAKWERGSSLESDDYVALA